MSDVKSGIKPAPLVISRVFAAPRELVFSAWSTAAHMKNWFSPEGFTVPEAEIDFCAGGVCAICMRGPDGQDHWSRGHFLEVVAPERLVMAGDVAFEGQVKFSVRTTVIFAAEGAGTKMTVTQDYEIFDEAFLAATQGAAEGWRTTLDKLEKEVARMTARNVVHDEFSLERVYDAAPAAVFHALTNLEAKAKWFSGPEGYVATERKMDVRPGGREHVSGGWPGGEPHVFDAVYFDVIPNERLVYTYEMHIGARKISVSLATVTLEPAGAGTKLTVTEQGVFLDGYEDAGSRKEGTGYLLDQMGEYLKG